VKTASLDILNIFLMIVSAIAAFFLPFQLFLFAYAVLGPLHYLTEINWLHTRNYFTTSKFDYLFLIGGSLLIFISNAFQHTHLLALAGSIMCFLFFCALVMTTVTHSNIKLLLYTAIALISLLVTQSAFLFVLFAILLPTIVHVFVFTGCFILHGALKHRSTTGLISVLVFIACFIVLFFLTIDIHTFSISSYVQNAYRSFESVNLEIMNLLNINNPDVQDAIYTSSAGLSIMRFIAFAYTYHYLNWFSKTKIIQWHNVSRRRFFSIIGLWILAVIIYIYDYGTGLFVLFFLSLAHVVLEFPLNHQSFIGIYREVKSFLNR
jgi:hypothetical protein